MAMSYHRILLGDHLADHLIYLSSSSSFWFSLNSSYEHDFHLSKRLGMTPKDYEYLLVAADLAHIDKRWGFSIKMMKWRLFLEGIGSQQSTVMAHLKSPSSSSCLCHRRRRHLRCLSHRRRHRCRRPRRRFRHRRNRVQRLFRLCRPCRRRRRRRR